MISLHTFNILSPDDTLVSHLRKYVQYFESIHLKEVFFKFQILELQKKPSKRKIQFRDVLVHIITYRCNYKLVQVVNLKGFSSREKKKITRVSNN